MSNGGIRLDLLLAECVGQVVKQLVPNGATVWDGGGREVAIAKLKEMGVTDNPLTMVDVARVCGLLGPDPNVVVVNPARVRRVPRV